MTKQELRERRREIIDRFLMDDNFTTNNALDALEALEPKMMSEDEIAEVVAQCYCTKDNEKKVVDPILIRTIAKALANHHPYSASQMRGEK